MLMMCQSIGRPPISTIGLGFVSVSSARRVPSPPARMTTFSPGLFARARRAVVIEVRLPCTFPARLERPSNLVPARTYMQAPVLLSLNTRRLMTWALWLWLLTFTFLGLDHAIGDGDECVHASALRDMIRAGDFLHLRYHGMLTLERPLLPYWLAAPFAR